jgi:hypothetical protein
MQFLRKSHYTSVLLKFHFTLQATYSEVPKFEWNQEVKAG